MKKLLLLFFLLPVGFANVFSQEKGSEKNLYSLIAADPDLSEFLKLLKENGLADSLKTTSMKLTVFAPVNAAIQNMDSVKRNFLFEGGTRANLLLSLNSHFAKHIHDFAELEKLPDGAAMKNLAYGKNVFHHRDGQVFLQDARIVQKDIAASNGIVHKIDSFVLYRHPSQ